MISIFWKIRQYGLWAFLALLLVVCVSCGDADYSPSSSSGSFLVLGDIHFNPFYDPDLFPRLMDSPSEKWADIFNDSHISQPQSWGKETNYPLLVRLLEALSTQVSSNPVVLFQGDILVHWFRETFFALYGEEDEAALRSFVLKTVSFFVDQLRNSLPEPIPVMFVLGNNDSYAGDYALIPGGAFLVDTAPLFYGDFLMGEGDWEIFEKTYRSGGYYRAQPAGSRVLFLCLNTLLFSVHWSGNQGVQVSGVAEQHLDWLEENLAHARDSGEKVWLLMHVPPGADVYGTVTTYMDASGRISDAAMMWRPEYQERFSGIVHEYRDVIQYGFSGHTHMDEYRLSVNGEGGPSVPVLVTPGISPLFGNNSAFKKFSMEPDSWELLDYESLTYRFKEDSNRFLPEYRFSSAYQMEGPLESSLATLWPWLSSDSTGQQNYIHFYYSGHDADNPISDMNWPAYWCAIGHMDREGYIRCVNSYQ